MGRAHSDKYDTKEFVTPKEKGSRKGIQGLICFLFACVLVVSSVLGIIGGAMLYRQTQNRANTAQTATPTASQEDVASTYIRTEAIVQVCVASSDACLVGSGVLISSDGYLLTCDHLFAQMRSCKITVTTEDASVWQAAYIGGDDRLDIAVLKIEGNNFAHYATGAESSASVGDAVYAVGRPDADFAGAVVTAGIVSASSVRVCCNGEYPQSLIRIDAPIVGGYSGGALFDRNGTLVGLLCAKLVSDDAEGIAYVIPMESIASVVGELMEHGVRLQRPKLGFCFSFVSPGVAQATGQKSGMVLSWLSPQCELATQGFAVGDRIIAVNEIDITSADVFYRELESAKEGDIFLLTIRKTDGEERRVSMSVTYEKGTNSYQP